LGGYHALPGLGFTEKWLGGWFTMIWYLLKVSFFLYIYIWLRGTLPRMRYDQFMKFGWKVLIPVSLAWIMVVSTLRALSQKGADRNVIIGFSVGVVLLVFAVSQLYESSKARKAKEDELGPVPAPSFPIPQIKKAGE
jgi:NADH-quinone oxidoreductase subunit H